MGDSFPKFKAAAVHAASVFLDREGTTEKVCRMIATAAANGAKLVVFPETFVPGLNSACRSWLLNPLTRPV